MPEQQNNFIHERQQPWLENFKHRFDQFENSTLQIYVGSSKVYEQVGKEVTRDCLEGDIAQKVQQALEKPQELKGSVRIVLDGEKVFQAKQGEILENKLPAQVTKTQSVTAKQGVEPERQQEVAFTTQQVDQSQTERMAVQPEVLPAVAAVEPKKVETQFVPQSWDDIRKLIAENQQKPEWSENAILQLLSHQSQQINELQQKLDRLQQMRSPLNTQVAKFFGELKNAAVISLQQVQQRAQQLPQDLKQFLGNKANEVQLGASERVNATKAAAIGKVVELKDAAERSIADLSAKALDSASRWLVHQFGKDSQATGVKVWSGNEYTFTASNQNTSIFNKSGQEIARDGKLTSAATGLDANRLSQLPQDVQQIAQKLQHQPKQTTSVGLKQ